MELKRYVQLVLAKLPNETEIQFELFLDDRGIVMNGASNRLQFTVYNSANTKPDVKPTKLSDHVPSIRMIYKTDIA